MKKTISIICFLLLASRSDAITSDSISVHAIDTKNNVLYLELGGSAANILSVNYERSIGSNFSLRIGYSSFRMGDARLTTLPLMAHYLLPLFSSSNNLDVGLGLLAVRIKGGRGTVFGLDAAGGLGVTGFIGYRYQPKDGGLVFKIGVAPVLLRGHSIGLLGLGFGQSF